LTTKNRAVPLFDKYHLDIVFDGHDDSCARASLKKKLKGSKSSWSGKTDTFTVLALQEKFFPPERDGNPGLQFSFCARGN